jgi:hypothetical protein
MTRLLPAPTSSARRVVTAAGVALAAALALAGCTSTTTPTGSASEIPITHVHGIVPNPTEPGFLLGTHEGIFTVTENGQVGAAVAGPTFDAMGLTLTGDTLLASGHPDFTTPAELGSPHLGIIRSTDGAQSWEPLAFTGEKDFHVLTAGPDQTVYGITTDSSQILTSTNLGETWAPAGASLAAFNLTVDATGRIIASTPNGLQLSTNNAATFTPWEEAPLIALLNASPDQQRIVGLGAGGKLWVTAAGSTEWTQVGAASEEAQVIAITDSGDILVVERNGITVLPVEDQDSTQ